MTKSITKSTTYAIITVLLLGGFGMTNPAFAASLTAEQQANLQAELSKLDEKFEKLVQEIQKQEQSIYKKYNVTAAEIGYDSNMYLSEGVIFAEDEKIADKKFAEIEKIYAKTLAEFGFVEPTLTKEKQTKMDQVLVKLDAKYDKIFEQLDNPKITKEGEAKLEKQLGSLDAEYDKVFTDFGFKYPKLTEEEQKKLDERLEMIDEQYKDHQYNDDQYESTGEFDSEYGEYSGDFDCEVDSEGNKYEICY